MTLPPVRAIHRQIPQIHGPELGSVLLLHTSKHAIVSLKLQPSNGGSIGGGWARE